MPCWKVFRFPKPTPKPLAEGQKGLEHKGYKIREANTGCTQPTTLPKQPPADLETLFQDFAVHQQFLGSGRPLGPLGP